MARDINQRLQQLRTRRDGSRGDPMFKSIPPAELWNRVVQGTNHTLAMLWVLCKQ